MTGDWQKRGSSSLALLHMRHLALRDFTPKDAALVDSERSCANSLQSAVRDLNPIALRDFGPKRPARFESKTYFLTSIQSRSITLVDNQIALAVDKSALFRCYNCDVTE